jgi:hypothetical protein
MGCIYNIPPVRSKDLPYVDVLSEAINNPIRMLAGWFIVTSVTVAPASLLLSYWMIGCYFMALKRFAEFRNIGDATRATAYRKSFRYFTSERLLVSVMFYASSAMLSSARSAMRYRLEMILAFPAIALVMALYLHVAMKDDSAAQNPRSCIESLRSWHRWWVPRCCWCCCSASIFPSCSAYSRLRRPPRTAGSPCLSLPVIVRRWTPSHTGRLTARRLRVECTDCSSHSASGSSRRVPRGSRYIARSSARRRTFT